MTLDLVILALGFACGWWAHRRRVERGVKRSRKIPAWPSKLPRPGWGLFDAILGSDR